jgi:tetratricopeptide (TPR) repeat protein
MYGVMISDMYDSEESPEQYSAEISGCSFVNQTSQVLNNAVYLQNSAHVLLKNNAITSNNLSIGFTHGIYAEYCPGEMLNIFNNSLSNCNNGMTIIQSSPYIAFNTLNGNSYGESGMFLDNSNGTIKYNVISDFYNSYYSFYSSPDLLKNTFDNSCDDNIYLSSSSVPVMHPLISGGSTYWFAGDNHITGSPYDAGILFDGDAYPDLNYGYNRFTLSGSNFYLSGINPSETSRDFYAVQNYWYDTPPDSSKFNVTNAESVIYSPYDNNSQSARQTNTFDTTDIGFGLKDTIHILESDNPNSAQELFLLAYQSEFNGEYEEAIGYYKEIVSEYKDSSNASSCLARIFNCYEKKQATVTEYTLLESYYSAISDDTTQSVIMRNISEDLAIQSNIKQGNIEEAISDYDEIYASNTNTPKGFHALINKEILSAGSGDNMSSGNSVEEIEFKQIKINALLKGLDGRDANAMMSTNSITLDFNLLQNYPNPFNPRTIINYDLPRDGIVTIKVYDILGRELNTLVNEMKTAGYHKIQFSAADLASGAYFYRMTAGDFVAVKKFVVLK